MIVDLGDFLSNTASAYQSSASGTVVPSGTWSSTPTPEKGKYLWTRITFSWTNDLPDTVEYVVNYIGLDGDNIPSITNAEIDALFV